MYTHTHTYTRIQCDLYFLTPMKTELYLRTINMKNQKAIGLGDFFVAITGREKCGTLFHKMTGG